MLRLQVLQIQPDLGFHSAHQDLPARKSWNLQNYKIRKTAQHHGIQDIIKFLSSGKYASLNFLSETYSCFYLHICHTCTHIPAPFYSTFFLTCRSPSLHLYTENRLELHSCTAVLHILFVSISNILFCPPLIHLHRWFTSIRLETLNPDYKNETVMSLSELLCIETGQAHYIAERRDGGVPVDMDECFA